MNQLGKHRDVIVTLDFVNISTERRKECIEKSVGHVLFFNIVNDIMLIKRTNSAITDII